MRISDWSSDVCSSDLDETIQLVCNGEIYNSPQLRKELIAAGHRFRTATDVEVILHLYEEHGANCVKHLRGMFSFAIWDNRTGTLLLAQIGRASCRERECPYVSI